MGERHSDSREVVCGDEFDFETDRLCFLFGFDQNMSACRTSFRLFRVERDPERFEVAANR